MAFWKPRLLVQDIPKELPPRDDDEPNIPETTQAIIFETSDSLSLPAFLYAKNSETGTITKYLAIEEDDDFDTEPDYTSRQQWLLNQRQGDQYDRVKEWIPDTYLADRESNNESDINLLNEQLVWKSTLLPGDKPSITDYDRYTSYSINELDEDNT